MDPVIEATLRAALALLFLAAAAHKLRDRRRFRATLAAYRLLPAALVPVAAALVPGVELAVAAALATPALPAAGPLAAAALLLVYAGAVAVNLARGRRHIDCGCGGPAARRPIGGWLVARNAALAAAALAALAPPRARSLLWIDAVTVLGATAALAVLWVSLDRLLAAGPASARLRGDA
jgi:hypothetical protein